MKKIISFSLFGSDPKYIVGILCNVEIAKVVFPDWVCRVYFGDSVPSNTINRLKTYNNCELVFVPEDSSYSYMMWRFLAIDECDVTLSRDADSRLSYREKYLVDKFILSECLFHDVRDHPLHINTMGGMWGMKKNSRVCMKKEINNFLDKRNVYGLDQNLIHYNIAPLFKDCTLLHDINSTPSLHSKNSVSNSFNLQNRHFIGEQFPYDNFGKPLDYIFY